MGEVVNVWWSFHWQHVNSQQEAFWWGAGRVGGGVGKKNWKLLNSNEGNPCAPVWRIIFLGMRRVLPGIWGLVQVTLAPGGGITVTGSSPWWGRYASEWCFLTQPAAHMCPAGPGAAVHVIVTLLWSEGLYQGPKDNLLGKDKGIKCKKDGNHPWIDYLAPGHSQSYGELWGGRQWGEVSLKGKKGILVEVTIKETLNPLSLSFSGTVVLAKSCVKVEVPQGHQSCPGRGLWKAVLFS